MEVLDNFGFDIRLFIAQIINFLVLIFLFKKFLYKPLLKTMRDRESKIRKGVTDADMAEKTLAEAEKKQDEIMKKASNEATRIIQEAKKTATDVREETLEKTRVEAQKIVNEAKEQGVLELEKIKREGEKIALTISQSILSRALEGMFTESEKKTIVERNVKNLISMKG